MVLVSGVSWGDCDRFLGKLWSPVEETPASLSYCVWQYFIMKPSGEGPLTGPQLVERSWGKSFLKDEPPSERGTGRE